MNKAIDKAIAEHKAALRRAGRARVVEDMREGRRQRAVTIPAKRGAGSYRRRGKYGRLDG